MSLQEHLPDILHRLEEWDLHTGNFNIINAGEVLSYAGPNGALYMKLLTDHYEEIREALPPDPKHRAIRFKKKIVKIEK